MFTLILAWPSIRYLKLNTLIFVQFGEILNLKKSMFQFWSHFQVIYFNFWSDPLLLFLSFWTFFLFQNIFWEISPDSQSKSTTLSTTSFFFRLTANYFCVPLNYSFYSNCTPRWTSHLVSPSTSFNPHKNLCTKFSSICFCITNSLLPIIFWIHTTSTGIPLWNPNDVFDVNKCYLIFIAFITLSKCVYAVI